MKQITHWLGPIALLLLLAGCGGSSTTINELEGDGHDDHAHEDDHDHDHDDDHDHDHDEDHHHSKGRLLVSEAGEDHVFIYEAGDGSVLESFHTHGEVTALHASPNHRYGLVVQRNDDRVNAVDSGLWLEEHGDHFDAQERAPELMHFELHESRPTHYAASDSQSVYFFDGDAEAGKPAAVALFDESHIGSDAGVTWLHYETHMHGAAQPRGDYLLASVRDPADTSTTLPDRVALYHRHGDHFDFEKQFDVSCPRLHGSAQTAHHVAFGCGDGVLLIEHDHGEWHAEKIANPEGFEGRIGSLTASPGAELFVGVASGHFYAIDPEEGSISPIDWGAEEGVSPHASGFADGGHYFVILDDRGDLTLVDAGHGWGVEGHYHVAHGDPAELPEGSRFELALSQSGHYAYVLDPVAREVREVDLSDGHTDTLLALDYQPHKLVWLGIAETDDHNHGDHDDHGHDDHGDHDDHGHDDHDHHDDEDDHDH